MYTEVFMRGKRIRAFILAFLICFAQAVVSIPVEIQAEEIAEGPDGGCDYVEEEKIPKITTLSVPKISSLIASGKGITIKWKKVRNASGYEIYRKVGKGSWKKITAIKKSGTASYIDSKAAEGGKTYSYKVRAYVKSGGSISYSAWSKSKKIKKEISGKIIEKDGRKYFQYADGKKAKKRFVTIKGKTYYFGKKGIMEKGWMKKGDSYYYFDRSTGVQRMDCTVDGIKLKKDGTAKDTSYNKKMIATMMEAKSIMNKVTEPTDTKEQKLKKVFDWVLKHPYKRYRILPQARKKKGWEIDYANDVYKKGNGCCVSEACAFAFLARECGYKEVYVCDDTGHAWGEVDGRVYDTLFAEAKSYKKYFNSDYRTARLHKANKLKF